MKGLMAIALVAAVATSACGGKGTTTEDKVLDALATTQLQSRVLDYSVVTDADRIGVELTIEDDYRYASELALDGSVAYREVVFDDALAAQLLDDDAAPLLGQAPDAEVALSVGPWIVDDLGAPATVVAPAPGADPIVDALEYFAYVRDAARSSEVIKFDEDALDYRPDEDPFDPPADGEVRYDVLPTSLPTRADLERAVGADVPELSDLRKLSVYVRDGYVVAVREVVDVEPFEDALRRLFGDVSAGALLERINDLRAEVGQDPLEPRRTDLLVRDRGETLRVDLPTGTAARLALHVGDVVATAPSE